MNSRTPKAIASATTFFLILTAYYILRSIRDEMGILAGLERIPDLFLYTLLGTIVVVPIFSYFSHSLKKSTLGVVFFSLVGLQTLVFYVLFKLGVSELILSSSFFVWLSVVNLFVISLFWSFTVDLFTADEAKQSFGYIAAGGSLGAILGPATSAFFGKAMGTVALLLPAALLFFASAAAVFLMHRKFHSVVILSSEKQNLSLRKEFEKVFSGFHLIRKSSYLQSICWYMILNSAAATFLYLTQASLLSENFSDSGERTSFFASIDLLVNCSTLLLQIFFTRTMLVRLGLTVSLLILPIVLLFGFFTSIFILSIYVLGAIEVLRRSINYAFAKPSREVLFTVVLENEKYAAKNTIDTFVYRLGDAMSSQIVGYIRGFAPSIPIGMYLGIPVCFVWGGVILRIGRKFNSYRETNEQIE